MLAVKKKYVRICCNTSPRVIYLLFSLIIPPSAPSLAFFPPSRSARKRMSVIMRTPSGKVRLYCKGAVSVCLSPWQHPWQPVTIRGTKHKCWKLPSPCCFSLLSGNLYNGRQHKATFHTWLSEKWKLMKTPCLSGACTCKTYFTAGYKFRTPLDGYILYSNETE